MQIEKKNTYPYRLRVVQNNLLNLPDTLPFRLNSLTERTSNDDDSVAMFLMHCNQQQHQINYNYIRISMMHIQLRYAMNLAYFMNFVNKLLHFRITLAVFDSSSCDREKSRKSSILPSMCKMACFSSTLPTPFFFVS